MKALKVYRNAELTIATLVLAFSGWMDGGNVSTGTVDRLVEVLGAEELAMIDSDDYYLFNFPGSMEMSSLFRPHIDVEDGLLCTRTPSFYCSLVKNPIYVGDPLDNIFLILLNNTMFQG